MSTDAQAHTAFATGYRADIDGLRAVAVIAVIVFHARFFPFSGGFVGVDVFFVISGFLITSIIKKEADRNDFSIAKFYERRIRRIFPALFFLLLAITPLALAVLLPVETIRFGQTLLSTALFAANIYFWQNTGYFAPSAERNPLLHTWSLAVEEQFYIFFPLFLLLLLKLPRRAALLCLGGVVLASLLLAEWQLGTRATAVFYLLPTRAWELLLGTVLALATLRTPSNAVATSAGAAGLALIAASVVLYSPYMDFPGFAAVPPCLGTVLVLYAGQRSSGVVARALSFRPVRFVGKISYSLYLWHLPPLVLARIHLDRELTALESLTLIGAATIASVISWRYVETPFRRVGKADVRWRVIGVGVTASVVFSLLGFGLIASRGAAARFAPEVVVADAAQLDRGYPPTCVGPYATGSSCADAPFEVLVWGDSHAAHYFAGIAQRAAAAGLDARLQWSDGCPAVLDAVPVTLPTGNATLGAPARRSEECAAINDEMLEVIRGNQSIKAVALAGAWDFWAMGVDIGTNEQRYLAARESSEIGVDESRRVLRKGLERTIDELQKLGLQVLLLGQVPDYTRSPSECMARAYAAGAAIDGCRLTRDAALERSAWSRDLLRQLAAAHGAAVFDPSARLCAGSQCLIEAGGTPFYRDSDHLSPEGSLFLGDALPADFFRAAPRPVSAAAGIG